MRNLLIVTTVICSVLLVTVMAVPVPEARPDPEPAPAPEPKTDIELMKIPLDDEKELDVITLVDSGDQKINERNKRTIGILRELFPTLSQILDQKIQMITSYLFRTIGPILLRSGLGGGAGGANAGGRGTADDDFDDDFDDDDDTDKNVSSDDGRKVSISLPTFPPSSDDDDEKSSTTDSTSTTEADDNDIRKRSVLMAVLPSAVNSLASSSPSSSSLPVGKSSGEVSTTAFSETVAPSTILNNGGSSAEQTPATTLKTQESTDSNVINGNSENMNTLESLDLAGLSDTLNAIRVARATNKDAKAVADSDDQKAAESSAKSSALDELSLDSEGTDEDRNKRFLSFGGSSGGAGGSGNFLFDIIRLVSGSSGTEHSDEKANSPDDHDNEHDHELGKGDGYTEGIPGPVTRLFVLANRGLSNLIQDLILRIAQTSERVVNFKARLITSLI
ncbi:dentin sialophosphoprotein [Topomyia yanbarensis]|uniref:dentin sialophosphoprotein n=1 Tax=Topomyia yanbarensis TaxID=2498891 RepID=UPI00273BA7D9|nr:dentin sialophosphoprotein [Topomyia yanbarensis]